MTPKLLANPHAPTARWGVVQADDFWLKLQLRLLLGLYHLRRALPTQPYSRTGRLLRYIRLGLEIVLFAMLPFWLGQNF